MSIFAIVIALWVIGSTFGMMFIAGAARLNREPGQIIHRYHAVPWGWHPRHRHGGVPIRASSARSVALSRRVL